MSAAAASGRVSGSRIGPSLSPALGIGRGIGRISGSVPPTPRHPSWSSIVPRLVLVPARPRRRLAPTSTHLLDDSSSRPGVVHVTSSTTTSSTTISSTTASSITASSAAVPASPRIPRRGSAHRPRRRRARSSGASSVSDAGFGVGRLGADGLGSEPVRLGGVRPRSGRSPRRDSSRVVLVEDPLRRRIRHQRDDRARRILGRLGFAPASPGEAWTPRPRTVREPEPGLAPAAPSADASSSRPWLLRFGHWPVGCRRPGITVAASRRVPRGTRSSGRFGISESFLPHRRTSICAPDSPRVPLSCEKTRDVDRFRPPRPSSRLTGWPGEESPSWRAPGRWSSVRHGSPVDRGRSTWNERRTTPPADPQRSRGGDEPAVGHGPNSDRRRPRGLWRCSTWNAPGEAPARRSAVRAPAIASRTPAGHPSRHRPRGAAVHPRMRGCPARPAPEAPRTYRPGAAPSLGARHRPGRRFAGRPHVPRGTVDSPLSPRAAFGGDARPAGPPVGRGEWSAGSSPPKRRVRSDLRRAETELRQPSGGHRPASGSGGSLTARWPPIAQEAHRALGRDRRGAEAAGHDQVEGGPEARAGGRPPRRGPGVS